MTSKAAPAAPRRALNAGRPASVHLPAAGTGAAAWLWLSVATVALAAVGSAVALVATGRIYGRETILMLDEAVAQDLVNLSVVCPLILVLVVAARRGSVAAYLCWLGALSFTAYNYAIYCFSLQFGPLFLLWVAVLGGSLYALIGGLAVVDRAAVQARYGAASARLAGAFLLLVATLFILLWLADIVPALLAGRKASSAVDINLPTNPVHVLDLAFFLPVVFAAGVLLLRRNAWGYTLAPGLLVFLAFTSLPVLITPIVADVRGDPVSWAVLVPITLILLSSLTVLMRLLRQVHRPTPGLDQPTEPVERQQGCPTPCAIRDNGPNPG
jgi:hypothetical protein